MNFVPRPQTRHQGYMELSLVEKILNEISENLVPKVKLHFNGGTNIFKTKRILNYNKKMLKLL